MAIGFLSLFFIFGCKKDELMFVTDTDGNVYKTITIGNRIWMAENLKTTIFSNRDPIQTTIPDTLNTGLESDPIYQWAYNGDENNIAAYGRLYTWFTVTDKRKICPEGWHLPTDDEWHDLVTYLDKSATLSVYESAIAGGMLKEAGTLHWLTPNTGSTNESGFNALPGGFRYNNGIFYSLGIHCIWWSSTEELTNDGNAWVRCLDNVSGNVGRYTACKYDGYSVRCVRSR